MQGWRWSLCGTVIYACFVYFEIQYLYNSADVWTCKCGCVSLQLNNWRNMLGKLSCAIKWKQKSVRYYGRREKLRVGDLPTSTCISLTKLLNYYVISPGDNTCECVWAYVSMVLAPPRFVRSPQDRDIFNFTINMLIKVSPLESNTFKFPLEGKNKPVSIPDHWDFPSVQRFG